MIPLLEDIFEKATKSKSPKERAKEAAKKKPKTPPKKTTKKRSKKKKSSTTKSRSTSNPWSGTPAEDVYEDIERGGAPEPEPEPSPEPSPQPSQPSPGPSPSQPPSPWSGTPAEEIYEDISRGGAPPPQQPFVGPPAPSAPTPTLVPTPQEKFKHDVAQSLPGKLKTDQLQQQFLQKTSGFSPEDWRTAKQSSSQIDEYLSTIDKNISQIKRKGGFWYINNKRMNPDEAISYLEQQKEDLQSAQSQLQVSIGDQTFSPSQQPYSQFMSSYQSQLQKNILQSKPSSLQFVPDQTYLNLVLKQQTGELTPSQVQEQLTSINLRGMESAPETTVEDWGKQYLDFNPDKPGQQSFYDVQQQDPSISDLDYNPRSSQQFSFERDYGRGAEELTERMYNLTRQRKDLQTVLPQAVEASSYLGSLTTPIWEGAGSLYRSLTGTADDEARRIAEAYNKERYKTLQAWHQDVAGDDLAYAKRYWTQPTLTDVVYPALGGTAIGGALGRVAAYSPTIAKAGGLGLAAYGTAATLPEASRLYTLATTGQPGEAVSGIARLGTRFVLGYKFGKSAYERGLQSALSGKGYTYTTGVDPATGQRVILARQTANVLGKPIQYGKTLRVAEVPGKTTRLPSGLNIRSAEYSFGPGRVYKPYSQSLQQVQQLQAPRGELPPSLQSIYTTQPTPPTTALTSYTPKFTAMGAEPSMGAALVSGQAAMIRSPAFETLTGAQRAPLSEYFELSPSGITRMPTVPKDQDIFQYTQSLVEKAQTPEGEYLTTTGTFQPLSKVQAFQPPSQQPPVQKLDKPRNLSSITETPQDETIVQAAQDSDLVLTGSKAMLLQSKISPQRFLRKAGDWDFIHMGDIPSTEQAAINFARSLGPEATVKELGHRGTFRVYQNNQPVADITSSTTTAKTDTPAITSSNIRTTQDLKIADLDYLLQRKAEMSKYGQLARYERIPGGVKTTPEYPTGKTLQDISIMTRSTGKDLDFYRPRFFSQTLKSQQELPFYKRPLSKLAYAGQPARESYVYPSPRTTPEGVEPPLMWGVPKGEQPTWMFRPSGRIQKTLIKSKAKPSIYEYTHKGYKPFKAEDTFEWIDKAYDLAEQSPEPISVSTPRQSIGATRTKEPAFARELEEGILAGYKLTSKPEGWRQQTPTTQKTPKEITKSIWSKYGDIMSKVKGYRDIAVLPSGQTIPIRGYRLSKPGEFSPSKIIDPAKIQSSIRGKTPKKELSSLEKKEMKQIQEQQQYEERGIPEYRPRIRLEYLAAPSLSTRYQPSYQRPQRPERPLPVIPNYYSPQQQSSQQKPYQPPSPTPYQTSYKPPRETTTYRQSDYTINYQQPQKLTYSYSPQTYPQYFPQIRRRSKTTPYTFGFKLPKSKRETPSKKPQTFSLFNHYTIEYDIPNIWDAPKSTKQLFKQK